MKKLIAALLGSTAIFSISSAQAETNWTGFYGGVFVGYGWSNTDVGFLDDAGSYLGLGDPCEGYNSASSVGNFVNVAVSDEWSGPPPQYYYCDYEDTSISGLPGQSNLGSFDADGEMIGVTAGINYQTGNWVFGIEAEGGLLGLDETFSDRSRLLAAKSDASAAFVLPRGTEIDVDGGMYVGAFGRLGYSFGDTLIYGKLGYGAGDLGITVNVYAPFCSDVCWSNSVDGMTEALMYGAGVEHMIGKDISLKIEYLRMDFADTQLVVQNGPDWNYYEFDTTVDTVKVGVNFKFGTPE